MQSMVGKWQWDDVRTFLAVAREGSLSGAARLLGVDHATVGRRIALLEDRLGAKLLNRTPEGFGTTAAGEAILTKCQAMEDAALSLERLVAGHDARVDGSVRVTAPDAMSYHLLVPCIAALRASHPALQIDLMTGLRKLDITRREADIAVRVSGARPAEPALVCNRLGDIGYALYASASYLERRGTPKRGEGLSGHDLITFAGQGWPRSLGSFFMGERLEGVRIALRSNDQFSQLRATAEGLGISELPCFLADQNDGVERVWPDEKPALRPVWLITHEDLRRAARVRLVSSAITEAFRRGARMLRNGRPHRARP
jgi:DNA-binding transcriptional LysR family regulator